MTDPRAKRAILAALSYEPSFSELANLPDRDSKAGGGLLRWLDRSGLALSFLSQLQRRDLTSLLSERWRGALVPRLIRNSERTLDMLREAQRLDVALIRAGVAAAVLKGFSLCPDFCEEPALRHQTDFDFLIRAADLEKAAKALNSCGYFAARLNNVGETCFTTPLQHVPSAGDDIYEIQRHRQVDLHISIWEPCPWLPVEAPQDCLEFAQPQTTCGVNYLSLTTEDRFLVQVLHAFRHSFRSWVRVSWLLEIARFMENHAENKVLWEALIQRVASTRLMKSIFAFTLGLANHLFHAPIPLPLRSWLSEATTPSLRAWLDNFALDWAVADWPGSLSNLFLTAEFIPGRRPRMQYWRSRFVPGRMQTSLGAVTTSSAQKFLEWQTARWVYVVRRATAHAGEIAALPWQQFRWKRAMATSRRLGFDAKC